ncbi:MAG: hypothetical protein FJ246_02290 [Nitrospira sp.]|nr:hypothetical protein [Nitrospira sp.]
MKRLQSVRLLSPIAVSLALLYVVLAIVASVCLFDHPASQASSHHHSSQQSGKAVHSALCVWACQANPGTSLVSAVPLVQPVLLVLVLLLVSCSVLSRFRRYQLFPRGPPHGL